MNRKRKINRKYMQMQTVGVFLLTLVVVLAVTWEINLNQVKREKLKASYTAESTVSRVESQLSKYLTESDMVKRMLEKGYTLDKKRFDSLAELMQENEDVIEARELAEDGVALVDVGRDGAAFLGQVDVVILIDGDQPALAHLAQDDGDRRAGIGEVRADVNGVNLVLLLRENVDRFQIVFDGFGYGHSQNHLHAPTARDARAHLYQLHYSIIPKFKQRESKKFGLFFCARAIDKSVSRC